LRPLN